MNKCLWYVKRLLFSGFTYFVLFVIFLVVSAKKFKTRQTLASFYPVSYYHVPDSLVKYAKSLQGIDYSFGGTSEGGFDCSGFTYFVFKEFSVKLPHSSRAQYNYGQHIPLSEAREGDLLFFKGRNLQSDHIGHVGIVIEQLFPQNFNFIHATVNEGVKIDSLTHPYYETRFMGATRVLE